MPRQGYPRHIGQGWEQGFHEGQSRERDYNTRTQSHHGFMTRDREYRWIPETADRPYSNSHGSPILDFNSQPYRNIYGHRHDRGYEFDHYSAAYQRPNASYYGHTISCASPSAPMVSAIPESWASPSSESTFSREATLSLPVPPASSQPQGAVNDIPFASYLQISLTPSKPLHPLPPSASRKLLILDLNGTLLVRSPHSHAAVPGSPKKGPEQQGQVAGKNKHKAPRLRHVYPRPYMAAFRTYLFAPSTCAWLDTMVWSSAQPHSVSDMVDKCFGEEKSSLVAVWARDTFGLRKDEYHRKAQTTKDLVKPWSLLTLRPSSDIVQQEIGDSDREPPSQTHSALTTILLDDSPLKAHLQPWNHVCIQEYSGKMRVHDLEVWRREKEKEWEDIIEQRCGRNESEKGSPVGRMKKKKRRKTQNADEEVIEPPSSPSALSPTPPPTSPDESNYDQTLLAIVGILDAIKEERNVAGWIRAGGLWGAGVPSHVEGAESNTELSSGSTEPHLASPPSTTPIPSPPSPAAKIKHLPVQWFEHPGTMKYWASRGRSAMSALGIEIDPGVGC